MATDIFVGLSDQEIFDMGFELGDISRIMSLRQPILDRPIFKASRENIIAIANNHSYRCNFNQLVQFTGNPLEDGLVIADKLLLTAVPLGRVYDPQETVKSLRQHRRAT